jgi:thiol:disulfide interchange protein
MAAFASGLALPFFLLALFPSSLKRLPRSGGWLATVKVVAGFLVLAASLKYLGGADQSLHWGVLTRERFLALWVALFAAAAAYLLGFLRLHDGQRDEAMGIGRLLSGVFLLAFALTLIPGNWTLLCRLAPRGTASLRRVPKPGRSGCRTNIVRPWNLREANTSSSWSISRATVVRTAIG